MNKQSFKLLLGALCIATQLNAVDMDNVYINGFISQGYLKSSANSYLGDTEDGTWEFNEAAISVKALLQDNLSAGIQLMSRDFGTSGNNDVKVDWAFLDYRLNDQFGIRVGKFKKPDGLYNTIRDADSVRTSILLPQGIYGENVRDITIAIQGVSVYGFLDANEAGSFDYILFLGNQPIDTDEPVMKDSLLAGFYGIQEDGTIEFKYSVGGQVFWNTPIDGLRFGQSFNKAIVEINGQNTSYPWYSSSIQDGLLDISLRTISSIEYQMEKVTLSAEYLYNKMTVTNAPIGGAITPYGFPAGGDYELITNNYYLQINYQIANDWTLGTYYSSSLNTTQGVDGDEDTDIAVSAKWAVTDSWTLKAEVHFFDGVNGATPDESGIIEENWQLFALKSTISF